ncbi:histidine phosphatase family protein [soil metagenome]
MTLEGPEAPPDPGLPDELDGVLVLVRHGESVWIVEGRFQGRGDPVLSERGERQASLVARRLRDPASGPPLPVPPESPVAIWHSPLSRARQTAEAIAEEQVRDVPLERADAFTEIDQGEWQGLPLREVAARYPEILNGWRREPTRHHAPGGESLHEAGARVRAGLPLLLDRLAVSRSATPAGPHSPIVVDPRRTHLPESPPVLVDGSPRPRSWAVLVAHDGIFRLVLMTLLGIPYARFWSFPFALCAITVIDVSRGRATLRAHNLADHLAPLLADPAGAAEARGDRKGAL